MAQEIQESNFSGFQLLDDDSTACRPELFRNDLPGNAPELSTEEWAPQVVLDGSDAIAIESSIRNGSDVTATESSRGTNSNAKDSQRYNCGISKKLCWILTACISTAAVAVAVGVGVGVGALKHSTNSPMPMNTTGPDR